MTFAIYSRKSVYTAKGESIENQVEMCKQYIFSKFPDTKINDITVYEDEGYSAKNTDRPQFQKMLTHIAQKKFNFVVCYRLDRLSRNVSDFSSLIEDLNDKNINFICIKEEFDTSKPMGKAMMYIASVFAQLERETIAERVRDNMMMLARTGRWLGGTTPTGFTSGKVSEIIIDGKLKSACKLEPIESEIAIVKIMFEKFLEIRSISGVSKYLIAQNITSRTGKMYSLLGIKEILQNPVYCIADEGAYDYFTTHNADVCFERKDCSLSFGLLSYNKRDYTKKHAPRQAMEKWIIAIGKHNGLITGNRWATVQNIVEANKPDGVHPARTVNDYSLLSGLIFCDKCGQRMFSKIRNYNSELFDYQCNSKLRGGIKLCNCQNLGGQYTDDIVCEYLMQYTVEDSDIYMLLKDLKNDLVSQSATSPIEDIDIQIKKHNTEINGLVDLVIQGKNRTSSFVERINLRIAELDKEIERFTQKRTRLIESSMDITGKEIQLDIFTKALSNLKENFDDLSVYDKRTLIRLLVKKIVWDGSDLHIFINGE